MASPFGRQIAGMDRPTLLATARQVVEAQPRTRAALMRLLGQQWPDRDPRSLAYAVTYLVPLVQVPPRGIWGATAQPSWTTLEGWLGVDRIAEPPTPHVIEKVILRYLDAFGPATASDLRGWSGLQGVAEVLEQLRPRLCTFRDADHDTELFDLPDAPRPDPAIPAPPRFLPEFDNVLVAYANRDRIVPREHLRWLNSHLGRPTLLVNGFIGGTWKLVRTGGHATLRVETFRSLPAVDQSAVAEEGGRLLSFLVGDSASHRIEFALL